MIQVTCALCELAADLYFNMFSLLLATYLSQDGVTALMIALHHDSSTVVEVLFRGKPDVNMVTYAEVHTQMQSRL